jgi:hypothetical protein
MSYYNLCGIESQHSNISKGKGGVHIKITGMQRAHREKWETTERSGETSGSSQLRLIETLFRDPSDVALPK